MVSFFGVDVGGVYIISLNNIVGIFVVNLQICSSSLILK
jgi:hypothetical protein